MTTTISRRGVLFGSVSAVAIAGVIQANVAYPCETDPRHIPASTRNAELLALVERLRTMPHSAPACMVALGLHVSNEIAAIIDAETAAIEPWQNQMVQSAFLPAGPETEYRALTDQVSKIAERMGEIYPMVSS